VRIGILGGTFDPPHVGHLIAAQDALTVLALDKVIFIPARVPPHKQNEVVSSPDTRLRMLKTATQGDRRFEVSDVELKRSGPSYTADTLRELKERHPEDEFFLLLGVDQVREFPTWREPATVLKLARLAMLARGGVEEAVASDIVHQNVPVTRMDVSSTMIRERVAAGLGIRYLVPAGVEEIIAAERLYSGGLG
jgi:nicotinate-nucleotide adenylyltransferase